SGKSDSTGLSGALNVTRGQLSDGRAFAKWNQDRCIYFVTFPQMPISVIMSSSCDNDDNNKIALY
ncbi:hypothetical protein SOL53_10485, partial [Klebsiella aerogenes]|uniref:hypothetical protein n=1 Tax=Klebsiella aerogenes TaxID=548 RepID=UPI002A6AEE12